MQTEPPGLSGTTVAASLNDGCYCRTLDAAALQRELGADGHSGAVMAGLLASRPTLFSPTAVFLSQAMFDRIVAGVACLERVIGNQGYQAAALASAPAIARHDFGPLGAFVSYDFHLAPEGPRLIEINSNAGGALLNAALARAQLACCEPMLPVTLPGVPRGAPEQQFLEMFTKEWRRQRGQGQPQRIAIVDDEPATQYLAPEFELFRRLFESAGMSCRILDASSLAWHGGRLWHEDWPIDLVYNRLTDFYLEETRHQALRDAYEAGAVVLTPHPRTHALYADKRNLARLSDPGALADFGIATSDIGCVGRLVPVTRLVTPENAPSLWAQRRTLFFKPSAGFAAKAAYRGDKLTRRVWGDILAGSYVAQALVAPSERAVEVDGVPTHLKLDLRAYCHEGRVQLLGARMYTGQTTNFRTPGGGFAAVVVLPA